MNLIDRYIDDENSICREERQYALYLYNALCAYMKKGEGEDIVGAIFHKTDKLVIDNVFYEATFMRDIFEYNRRKHFANMKNTTDLKYKTKKPDIFLYADPKCKATKDNSFNYSLLKYFDNNAEYAEYYLNAKERANYQNIYNAAEAELDGLEKEYHLGLSTFFAVKDGNPIVEDMKCMMNAKPDLAIIYHYDEEGETGKKLLFLECKFESSESKDGRLAQTELQYLIADFLCNKFTLYPFGCEVSPLMKARGEGEKPASLKVAFFRYDEKDVTGDIKISINSLIAAK